MDLARRLGRDQRGLSLVDLLMGMSILSVAVVALGTLMPGIQRNAIQVRADDGRAQMALRQLDHQIRWASAVFDPSVGPGCAGCEAGYALAVYQAGDPDRAPTCSLWQVGGDGRLLTTSFTAGTRPDGGWRVVATGLANRTMMRPAFEMEGGGSRTVEITLATGSSSRPSWLHLSVASRNASLTAASGVCGVDPAA